MNTSVSIDKIKNEIIPSRLNGEKVADIAARYGVTSVSISTYIKHFATAEELKKIAAIAYRNRHVNRKKWTNEPRGIYVPRTTLRLLPDHEAREIRKKYNDGARVLDLAKEYDVRRAVIDGIVKNKTYNDV